MANGTNGKKPSKARAAGKWAAIASAIATPFCLSLFSYLESRDASRAVSRQETRTEQSVTKSSKAATSAYKSADAGYALLVKEADKLWKYVDQLHARIRVLETRAAVRSIRRANRPRPRPPKRKSTTRRDRARLPPTLRGAKRRSGGLSP